MDGGQWTPRGQGVASGAGWAPDDAPGLKSHQLPFILRLAGSAQVRPPPPVASPGTGVLWPPSLKGDCFIRRSEQQSPDPTHSGLGHTSARAQGGFGTHLACVVVVDDHSQDERRHGPVLSLEDRRHPVSHFPTELAVPKHSKDNPSQRTRLELSSDGQLPCLGEGVTALAGPSGDRLSD